MFPTSTATSLNKSQLAKGNETVRKIILGVLTFVVIAGLGALTWKAYAEDQPAPAPTGGQPAAGGATTGGGAPARGEAGRGGGGSAPRGGGGQAGGPPPPLDLVKNTPKGGLRDPYNGKWADVGEEGHKKFLSFSCNGCHGGGGGGGMCPPLTNDIWVYGPDDDTLFRLVSLGSDELKKQG